MQREDVNITDWINFVNSADTVKTEEDYLWWCRVSLKKILPFDLMVTAVGRRYGDLVAVDEIDLIGYPESYRLELMNGDLRISERKALDFWLKNKCPLIIDLTDAEQKLSEKELAEFRSNNLQNIWAHGVIDPDGQKASYFSFSGSNELCSEQVSLRLRMVTPYLHQVRSAILWSRLSQNGFIHAGTQLTAREMEVLQCIAAGRTNAEIAAIFQRSTLTIKNQTQSILKKLDARSRTDAVRISLQKGLISIV
jgi:DNA-binding CsgD family transcriptional regulator